MVYLLVEAIINSG